MATQTDNLAVKSRPSLTEPRGLRIEPPLPIPVDLDYWLALLRIRETQEYRTLKSIIQDPYGKDRNFVAIVDFLEAKSPFFYRYLSERQAGIPDPEPVNAARVLEFARLLSELVERHPEFADRIKNILLTRGPGGPIPISLPSPSELVEQLEQLNRREYPMKKPSQPLPANAGAAVAKPALFPAPERERLEEFLQKLIELMEKYISRNSNLSISFSFEAKCSLLGCHEWGEIIDAAKAEFPEFKNLARLDLLQYLKQTTGDSRAEKLYYHLRQFVC